MYEELVISLRNNADHYMTVEGAAGLVHLLTDAADAIEARDKAAEEWEMLAESWRKACKALESRIPRWIPVTEAPTLKVGDEGYPGYLVYVNGYYDVADYGVDRLGNGPRFLDEYELDIMHYMPLPEPPERPKEEA